MAVSQQSCGTQDLIKEYHDILLHGVSFFKPPATPSRKTLENATSLSIDKKKIPITSELRSLALELSGYLVSRESRSCHA